MNLGSHARAAWLPVLASAMLAVAGCVTPGEPVAAGADAPGSDAERLALALAEADDAFESGHRSQLTAALRRIDALDAAPLDENATQLARWRQAADVSPPTRGRPLGPGFRSGEISPGRSEQLEQVFLSGERASIALSSPGKARLTLEVHDRREEPVCGGQRSPNHCQWVPIFTDRYRIRIVNSGQTAARYFLVIE
jgi:hypothetical protein